MRRATKRFWAFAMLLGFASPASSTGYIGVYADSLGWQCNFGTQDGVIDFYIIGSAPGGIQGAELRVTGLPAGSVVLSKALHPNAIEIGDALGLGVDIAFPSCDTDDIVILYHYSVLLSAPPPIRLKVEAHYTPSNPNFECPHTVMCDDPVFTKNCVSGGTATIAPPSEPVPPDGAIDIGANTQLAWTPGFTPACGFNQLTWTSMFFGTLPDPPLVAGSFGNIGDGIGVYDPGPLGPNTTYYWRVEQQANGTVSSPVWSFTTADFVVSVDEVTWNAVKQLYR